MYKKSLFSLIFILFLIPLAFSATNSFYSTIWVNATADQTKLLILNLSSNQTVLQKNFDGLEIRDITSSKDGFIVLTATNVNPRQVLTLDANLNIVKNFTFTVNSTLDVASCYRVNSTLYFCSGIFQSATGSMPIIEVDGNGNILNTKNVSQIDNIGIDAGSPKFKLKMWDFINATGKRYLLLGYDVGGIQQDGFTTKFHYLSLGSNDTIYRLFDFDNGSEWISYYNITYGFSGKQLRSFGFLDTPNNKVYIGGAGIPNSEDSFLGSNIVVWNINSTFQNTSFVKNVTSSADYNLVSRDILSLIIMSYAGSIQEDTTQSGLGYVQRMDFSGNPNFSVGAFLGIVELNNASSVYTQTGSGGVTFQATEGTSLCGAGVPINNVLFNISNSTYSTTCVTATGSTSQSVVSQTLYGDNYYAYHNATDSGGFAGVSIYAGNPNIAENILWNLSNGVPLGANQIFAFNIFQNYPVPVNPFQVFDNFSFLPSSLSLGNPYSNLFINCSSWAGGSFFQRARVQVLTGYNSTHYFAYNLTCFNDGSTSYGAFVYLPNTSTSIPFFSNLPYSWLDGNNIELTGFNSSIPVIFDKQKGLFVRNIKMIFSINDSGKNWNNLINSHISERDLKLNYTMNNSPSSFCSVGTLASGSYNFVVSLPSGYVNDSNGNQIYGTRQINGDIGISVMAQKIRQISLQITLKAGNNNLVGATCSTIHGSSVSNASGICTINNVPINSLVNVTISPNNPQYPERNISYQVGDYYNSQRFSRFGNDLTCSLFDGIYKFNTDITKAQKTIKFTVYDYDVNTADLNKKIDDISANFNAWCNQVQNQVWVDCKQLNENDQNTINNMLKQYVIVGAEVSIDNNQKCTTNDDGICFITWTSDFGIHTITSKKAPYYNDFSQGNIPLQLYGNFQILMNRNASYLSAHPEITNPQGIKVGAFGTGGIGDQVLVFIMAVLTIPNVVLLVLAGYSFRAGMPQVGIALAFLVFIGFMPFIIQILIVAIAVFFLAKFGMGYISPYVPSQLGGGRGGE